MSRKLCVRAAEQYPEILELLNHLLVQGAKAYLEDGRLVIEYDEEKTKTAKSRNAGRKAFGPEKRKKYARFCELYAEGKTLQEISEETGMSIATCYRYRTEAESQDPLRDTGKKKYILYRSMGDLDRNVNMHELIGVEYGDSIDEIAEQLIQDVADDLSGLPEYQRYETDAWEPEPVDENRKVKRYQYSMVGIVYGADAGKNVLIEYGITEK